VSSSLTSKYLSLYPILPSLFILDCRGLATLKYPQSAVQERLSTFKSSYMHRYSLRKTAARNEATDEAPRPQAERESSLSPSMPDAELGSDDPEAGTTPTRASRSYREVAALDEKAHALLPRREEAVRFDSAPPDEVSISVHADDESEGAEKVYDATAREEGDPQAKELEWQTEA
jgi:hypothetical protein